MSDATLITVITSVVGSGGLLATLGTLWVKNREADSSKYEVVLGNLMEQVKFLTTQQGELQEENKRLRERNDKLREEARVNGVRISQLEKQLAELRGT